MTTHTPSTDAGSLQGYKTCPNCGCILYAGDNRPCKWREVSAAIAKAKGDK